MADLKEIKKAKKDVQMMIANEISKRPDIGPYEFLVSQLALKGVNTLEIRDMESARAALKTLSRKDRSEIRKTQRLYNQEYYKAMEELNKGNFDGFKKLPRAIVGFFSKGIAAGVGVAGVVNTIAPNLFPTLVGYYAGSAPVNALTKLGLISIGAFSTPAIAHEAVLVTGAVIGAAVYTVGKGAIGIGKAVHKKIEKNKAKENKDDDESR